MFLSPSFPLSTLNSVISLCDWCFFATFGTIKHISEMSNFITRLIKHPFIVSLLLMVVVTCGLFYGVLSWLDTYTRHNQAVVVPDVKGMGARDAVYLMESRGIKVTLKGRGKVCRQSLQPGLRAVKGQRCHLILE